MKCPRCEFENPDTVKFCSECGTQISPTTKEDQSSFTKTLQVPVSELIRGTLFADRYEIIEELGKGGMGSVYRAEDTKIHEEVALKLIRPEISAENQTIERFKNELKSARKITHRNVCRMFDLGEAEGTHFIAMEYIPGEDLKSFIRRSEKLSMSKAIDISIQVCEGLAEAHRLGVIHRDLKPANIMIDKEGNVRIMDFGIARSLKTKGITGTGVMIGTPEYMSPEQVEGIDVDIRSDIYSIGVIMYEMTTGEIPFHGETPFSIAMKHKSEAPQAPQTINPQVPTELNRLILKCLEKEKENRYQSTQELLSHLSIIVKQPAEETRTYVEAIPEIKIPPEKEALKSIAVLPFKDMSPQQDQEYFCDGLAEELINALTQVKDLRVVARSSSFSFKGKDVDVREIGKTLEVGSFLEGSVQKAGNRLRITAQLVNVTDGYHLWSERFDRTMDDIFAIQDEISLSVVEKLKGELLEEEKVKVTKRHTADKNAYNLYLKGRYLWNRRYPGDMIRAVDFYHRAIKKDSNYALPYVGIADVFNIMGQWAIIHPKVAYSKSKAMLQKALEIDSALSELYSSLGFMTQGYEWDLPKAEDYFLRSIELNPQNTYAHGWYGNQLGLYGRKDEALALADKAIACDPLFSLVHSLRGIILALSGEAEAGRDQILKSIAMDPDQPMPNLFLGMMYLVEPVIPAKAIEALQKPVEIGLTFAYGHLGMAYAMAGQQDKAFEILAKLDAIEKQRYIPPLKKALMYLKPGLRHFRFMKKKYVSPLLRAWIYLGLGMNEEALNHFEMSAQERDYFFPTIILGGQGRLHPGMVEVASDPRFIALQNKVKLE